MAVLTPLHGVSHRPTSRNSRLVCVHMLSIGPQGPIKGPTTRLPDGPLTGRNKAAAELRKGVAVVEVLLAVIKEPILVLPKRQDKGPLGLPRHTARLPTSRRQVCLARHAVAVAVAVLLHPRLLARPRRPRNVTPLA